MNSRLVISALGVALIVVGAGMAYAVATVPALAEGMERAARRVEVVERFDQTLAVGATPILRVDNSAGELTVIGGDAGSIIIGADRQAWAADEQTARDLLAQLPVEVEQNGDDVAVRVRSRRDVVRTGTGVATHFAITVPRTTRVELANSMGEVSVADLDGRVDIGSRIGKVEVRGVLGDVSIDASHGDLTISDVQGAITVQKTAGGVRVANVSGNRLAVAQSHGEVQIENAQIESEIEIRSTSGQVQIQGSSADLVAIQGGHGSIEVAETSGRLDVRAISGPILLTRMTAPAATVDSGHGEVFFSGSLGGAAESSFRSISGRMHIALPKESAFALDATSRSGSFSSDLPILVQGARDGRRTAGTINGGTTPLTIRVEHGDIQISSYDGTAPAPTSPQAFSRPVLEFGRQSGLAPVPPPPLAPLAPLPPEPWSPRSND